MSLTKVPEKVRILNPFFINKAFLNFMFVSKSSQNYTNKLKAIVLFVIILVCVKLSLYVDLTMQ